MSVLNRSGHVRITMSEKGNRDVGLSGIISKHWFTVFVFLWFWEIDIDLVSKDWFKPEETTNINGKKYIHYVHRYPKENTLSFVIPNGLNNWFWYDDRSK